MKLKTKIKPGRPKKVIDRVVITRSVTKPMVQPIDELIAELKKQYQ